MPKGVRATTDRIREAVFSILGEVQNRAVLDLYAGSGSLGIEALSRGAREAWFVDKSRRALSCIDANLKDKKPGDVRFIRQDSREFLVRADRSFDWVFCDPPYEGVDLSKLLRAISDSKAVGSDSLVVLETDRFHTLIVPEELVLIDLRKFGDTVIHFIKRAPDIKPEPSRA